MTVKPFRNQRARFRNYSPPYADKATYDPREPGKGTPPRGGVPSPKNGRTVAIWTIHEYRAAVLLEASVSVRAYEERPERIQLRDGPRWYGYVPHFRVERDAGTAILELSSAGQPESSRQSLVASLAHAHYAARGVRFVELAHAAIRAEPRFTDALRLTGTLHRPLEERDTNNALDLVAGGPLSLAHLVAASGLAHVRLLALVRTGVLALHSLAPITDETLVGLPLVNGSCQ